MHRGTSSEVEATHRSYPPSRIPSPACNRIVNYRGPDHHEDDTWKHAASFSDGANSKGDSVWVLVSQRNLYSGGKVRLRYRSEHALVDGEEEIRDLVAANRWRGQGVPESDVVEVTDEFSRCVGEGERKAPEEPLERGHARRHH